MHILAVRLEWVEWIINNLFDYRQKGPATAGPFAFWEGAAGIFYLEWEANPGGKLRRI
jgi:hypothetical protein